MVCSGRVLACVQFALATPVVLWGGWPFFVRMWQSIVNRYPNMFTLIGIGTGDRLLSTASIATFFPQVFPDSFRSRAWRSRFVLRIGGGDCVRWCCLGRCWSFVPAVAPARRFARCLGLAAKTARRIQVGR